jgi:mercuric ion transport protein
MKKDNVVLGGGMLAAVAASLCCVGPVLFALLGIGAFGASSVFVSLRPYLLAVAVLALAFGFYRAYFRREACAPGDACATKPVSQASRVVLWVAAAGVLAFALSPYYAGYIAAAFTRNTQTAPAIAPSVATQTSALETVTIEVTGMDCQSCEVPINAALDNVQGVRSADVCFERGNARVQYDPSQTDVNQIRRAIDSTGFMTK